MSRDVPPLPRRILFVDSYLASEPAGLYQSISVLTGLYQVTPCKDVAFAFM